MELRRLGYKPLNRGGVVVAENATVTLNLTMAEAGLSLQAMVTTGVVDPATGTRVPFTVGRVSAENAPVPATNALETIQGKNEDLMGLHLLQLRAEIQQPWGQIFAFVEGIQYFAGYTTLQTPYRINTFLSLEYRIFRGLDLDIFGRYSSINDQFYLPAEGLSEEEILLRRRQRATNFRFNFGVGLSYRFGSKFANVVNPRID